MRNALLCGLVTVCLPVSLAAAAPVPGPYEGTAQGRFFHIFPPGEAGVANAPQAAQFLASGTQPAHFSDQRDLYTNLLYASPGIKDSQIGDYFPDASFGVKPGDVARTYSPRFDVTIVRDSSFGFPHVYGSTRSGTSFGLGYAVAEDRLFFMDVLRHYGNATLASFAGGSNASTDRGQFEAAAYSPADLQRQVEALPKLYGQAGQNIVDDAQAWCDGVNAYIARAKLDPLLLPVEYPAINRPQGPDPFTVTDVLNVASLIGAQLGNGGGNELDQVQQLMAEMKRFGPRRGLQVWQDFRSQDDPESPVTATAAKGFPYDQIPKRPLGGVALPDAGSLTFAATEVGKPDTPAAAARKATGPFKGLLHFPTSDSNALLVSAKASATGHPLAVFGSQAGYFQPEIWWGVDAHGPGFDVRGATIPGTGPYVEIGRGRDYAWSATSAGQDIIDVYALDLCNADGTKATTASTGYVFRGKCLAMEPVERRESWVPSAADQTPAGSQTLRIMRTKLGLVVARATIKGTPVVYTKLRSTYGHELDSAVGFQAWNDPEKVHDVRSFQQAAANVGYTFNWLYTDDKDIGYINTGANPQRPKSVNGLLPIRYTPAREWKGFDPETNLATYQPISRRPQAINQRYLVSWNNKQGRHCCGGSSYTPLWRSQLLTDGLDRRLAGGHKLALSDVVDAAQDAATQDLRGVKVLPWALKVVGRPQDPKLAAAVATLRAWAASGAHRIDRNRDGHYEQSDAVRLMDAWYQTMPKAIFGAKLGPALFARLDAELQPDIPNDFHSGNHEHLGSAWEDGWYGYMQKELRTVVSPRTVRGKWHVRFCGNGKLTACRTALRASLAEAMAIDPAKLYNDPTLAKENCGKMDMQACFDALRYRPLGLIKQPMQPWQNRPTQQQVVEVTSHRPR
jgi:acyl-homoserine lactone acylase PvdQ